MSGDATRAVRIERLCAVYRQLPLTLSVSVLNALVTGAVLAPRAGWGPIALWWAGFALMAAPRFIAWWRFIRLPKEAMAQPLWTHIAVGGSLASGMLWGACVLFLMPAQDPYPMFVGFVIGGMCAGSVTVNAAHPSSLIAFILPATLPLAGWFVWQDNLLAFAMAFMTTLFAGALLVAGWRHAKGFAAGVRARAALAERTEELAAANARLRAEIVERERAEAALRQSQKMEAIGNLTAGIAHDVNNVLMVVRGAAEILKRRLAHAPGHLRQVAAILRATERGTAMTRRLLAFARKESLNPDVVDANALLRGITTLLSATLGKSVRIVLDLDAAVPPVFVDRSGFEHAILNLAINARDAMPEGGTLTFRTALTQRRELDAEADLPAGDYVVVTVADTGTGMTEEVKARAFDPFFTTKQAGQGSGLGLSQVYGFIRQSGGGVRIESAPGAGTSVQLYLPPADAAQALRRNAAEPPELQATPPDPDASSTSPHIALVDDEDLVREVVTELLESTGYRVSAFARAADALRCVEHDPSVALLITDVGLTNGSGQDVARQAREARPGLPVLFITGYNDPGQLAEEPWLLRKPFAEADLLATVARALRQRSAAV
jgi:signal transduction histidine kinase